MKKNKFELRRVSGQPVTDTELIDDLIRVSKIIKKVTQHKYDEIGKYDPSTVCRRFGTWNNALKKAGLFISNEVRISDERLFSNILNLWQHLGRQPRRSDLTSEISMFSQSPYNRRFGSWTATLENFIEFVNSNEQADLECDKNSSSVDKSKRRDPSLRLRYKVLKRDNFSCCHCGASPAKDPSVVLHIDHIVPYSKGGDTVLENLQTLCANCNLGKGCLFED